MPNLALFHPFPPPVKIVRGLGKMSQLRFKFILRYNLRYSLAGSLRGLGGRFNAFPCPLKFFWEQFCSPEFSELGKQPKSNLERRQGLPFLTWIFFSRILDSLLYFKITAAALQRQDLGQISHYLDPCKIGGEVWGEVSK